MLAVAAVAIITTVQQEELEVGPVEPALLRQQKLLMELLTQEVVLAVVEVDLPLEVETVVLES
jgi:hypothetical protein